EAELAPAVEGEYISLAFLEKKLPPLDDGAVLSFERQGHCSIRQVFSSDEMELLVPSVKAAFAEQELAALQQKVSVYFRESALAAARDDPDALRAQLEQLPPEQIPFLQARGCGGDGGGGGGKEAATVFNLFRSGGAHSELVRRLVTSKRLAAVASQLLGCDSRVLVYQDSVFVKRPGDGPTRWHSDLNMAPFDTNDFITIWIPLADVPAPEDGGTGLLFASRSHRDFALNYWQDPHAGEDLSERYREESYGAMALGE
ncbi:unnamed protein product, partial [Phaeothamnion confervicola]